MANTLDEVGRLTDTELVFRLERLAQADRALSAKLLVHLGELDERKLFLGRGFSSTYNYCKSASRMSEAEAYLRIQAARVGRRFPLVVARLGAGAVHLSAIKLLSPHLTEDNHVQLLDRVRGRTKREIELLVELAPKPDVPARIRKLPKPRGPAAQVSPAGLAPAATPKLSSDSPAAPQVSRAALVPAATQSFASDSPAAPQVSRYALVPAATQSFASDSPAAPQASSATPAKADVQAPTSECASNATELHAIATAPSLSFALQSPRPRAACTPM